MFYNIMYVSQTIYLSIYKQNKPNALDSTGNACENCIAVSISCAEEMGKVHRFAWVTYYMNICDDQWKEAAK